MDEHATSDAKVRAGRGPRPTRHRHATDCARCWSETSGRCNFGDFQDIGVAPDGTPWVSLIDACVSTCINPSSDAEKINDTVGDGIVGRIVFDGQGGR